MEKNQKIFGQEVYGVHVNPRTGCTHYASALDLVAIKFKCCQRYYACYSCHQALADHPAERWLEDEFHLKAILCGHCGMEMTIHQYLNNHHQCPKCQSAFNPGCRLHWKLYFALKEA